MAASAAERKQSVRVKQRVEWIAGPIISQIKLLTQVQLGRISPGCRTVCRKTECCQFKEKELRHYLIITLDSIFFNTSPRFLFSLSTIQSSLFPQSTRKDPIITPFACRVPKNWTRKCVEIFKFPRPIWRRALQRHESRSAKFTRAEVPITHSLWSARM
jgi:hypothetical protein